MSTLRIDIDQLAMALNDHSSEWLLDMQTGDIVMREWLRDPDAEFDEDELDAPDLPDEERYLSIEPIASHEGFGWMEDFAVEQTDDVRERLMRALDGNRPFRRFKDALLAYPEVRDAWFRYEDEKLKQEARSWLASHGIEDFIEAAPEPPSA